MARRARLSAGTKPNLEVYPPINSSRRFMPVFEDVYRCQNSILRQDPGEYPLELLFCPIINAIRFRCFQTLSPVWYRRRGSFPGYVALTANEDIAFRISDNGLFPETLELGKNIRHESLEAILPPTWVPSPTSFELLYQVQISRYTSWKTSGREKIKVLQVQSDLGFLILEHTATWYGNTVALFLSCARRLAQEAGDTHLICTKVDKDDLVALRREIYQLATNTKTNFESLPVLWGFMDDQNPQIFRDFLKITKVVEAWVEGKELYTLPFLWGK